MKPLAILGIAAISAVSMATGGLLVELGTDSRESAFDSCANEVGAIGNFPFFILDGQCWIVLQPSAIPLDELKLKLIEQTPAPEAQKQHNIF